MSDILKIKNGDTWTSIPAIKGDPGRDGTNGTNGRDGVDGVTPVKGTDYFTASEIAEIESEVASEVNAEITQELPSKITELAIPKPTETPTVGKVLKVRTVNADGTFVCEWADDENDNEVTDVQVNGTSILADGVANIDSYDLIRNALTDGKGTAWTATEQAEARKRIGVDKLPSEIAKVTVPKPVETPVVGKVLKVKSVNEDGTFTCEWADETETDLTGYVKDTDYATASKGGTIKIDSALGLQIVPDGRICAVSNEAWIPNRSSHRIMTYDLLDKIIKAGMTDGKGTAWTATEQAEARKRIGVDGGKWELIESTIITDDNVFVRTAEPNGTPYNFKKLRIELFIPMGVTTANYICFNSPSTFSWDRNSFTFNSNDTKNTWAYGVLDCSSGYMDGEYGANTNNAAGDVSIGKLGYNARNSQVDSITSIRSYIAFPPNTTIKIYGIRA